MTISGPNPGNLVAKVDEIVNLINSGEAYLPPKDRFSASSLNASFTASASFNIPWGAPDIFGTSLILTGDPTIISFKAGLYALMIDIQGTVSGAPSSILFNPQVNVPGGGYWLPNYTGPFVLLPGAQATSPTNIIFNGNGIFFEAYLDSTIYFVVTSLGNVTPWTGTVNFDIRRLQ